MVYFSFCKVLVMAPFSFLTLVIEVCFFPWSVWLKISQYVDLLKEPTFGFVDFCLSLFFYFILLYFNLYHFLLVALSLVYF